MENKNIDAINLKEKEQHKSKIYTNSSKSILSNRYLHTLSQLPFNKSSTWAWIHKYTQERINLK